MQLAWQYREDLREILNRKQSHVVQQMLKQWCTNLMRLKIEAINGLFQAAKRKARSYRCLITTCLYVHLVVCKLIIQ